MHLINGRFCILRGPKLQIHENTMSNTLKCQKFNLGINNESVFLVDWYEIRKNVCKRTWILTHANHPATSTAPDVHLFSTEY